MTKSESNVPAREPRAELDRFFALVRRTARFWRTAVLVLLVGEVACLVFLLVKRPLYRSQTVLLYTETIRTAETGEPATTPKSMSVRMQELLSSRHELGQVIEELDLYPDVRKSYGTFDAVDELRKHVEFRAPGGDTFSIAFHGTSPAQARDVTAKLAELVVSQDAELRKKQTLAAKDFLTDEKKRAAERLKHAELDLAGFLAAHPSFALDAMPLATGAAVRASVAKPGSAAGPARPRVIALWPKKEPVAAAPSPAEAPPPSPAALLAERESIQEVARAAAAVEAARQSVAENRERYTDAHPDVRSARDALSRAETRLATARAKQPALKPSPAPAAPLPVTEGAGTPPRYLTLPGPKASASNAEPKDDLVVLETEWARLTRSVTEARQRHDQVEVALFKADLAESSASGGQGAQATVIDPAYLPQRPVPPGPRTLALLFFAASALAGIAAALARAVLDDRIYDSRGAEGLVEVLAEIPRGRRAGA